MTSPKVVAWSWDRGCNGHRILGRVPYRWKASWIITSCRLSRDGIHGDLGGLRILRPAWRDQKSSPAVTWQHLGSWVRREGEPKNATGMSEARSHPRRGKNTPTLFSRETSNRDSRWMMIRRSGLGCRETPGPLVTLHGALVSVGHPRCESGERSWERTRCGCT